MTAFKANKREFLKVSGAGVALALSAHAPQSLAQAKAATDVNSRVISEGWQFRQVGAAKWLSATVPGTVHTDLLDNKRIDDPFYRTNERNQQWIDKLDWEYRTNIDIDAQTLSHHHVELHFDGLDTYADVYVNDVLVLSADNMFLEWTIDVKKHVRVGSNTLRIYFHSPIRKGLAALEDYGYLLPSPNDQSENGGMGDRRVGMFTRKAGYHYGWDWGPRFVTSGIWRPVKLRAWSGVQITDLHIIQDSLSDKAAKLRGVFEVEADQPGPALIEITSPTHKAIQARTEVELNAGLNRLEASFEIKNPKRWWTNGLGEAFLYTLSGRVVTASGAKDERVVKTGLRTVRIVQEPDAQGTSFYVELNGVPVFMKGANYIPNDSFLPRVTKAVYEKVVSSALDTHMNMLRVWGGGVYEDPYFYELCDQKGILVWQDFMFACAMYPGDQAFLENVRKEAVHNVKRLRNHPCIALWCGNNEIDVAWQHDVPNGGWGWKPNYTPDQQKALTRAYDAIFHEVLAQAVATHDPKCFYWPSSPIASWDGKTGVVHSDVKAQKQAGDIHYWDVWWGQKPFSEYRTAVGRFMSEYGFQSFPEFRTVQAYTVPEDHDIFSEVMKAHQRSSIGNGTIRNYMERDYKIPKDFQQFLYVGQVLQAEGIKVAMETHRVRMPYCMGSLFWQINDCWPVASWSSIDYFGRWKAQQYYARRAFAPVLVSPVLNGEKVDICVVSDRLTDTNATLSVRVMDFAGKVATSHTKEIRLKANQSGIAFSAPVSALLGGLAPDGAVLSAKLRRGKEVLSENVLYFQPVKNLTLPEPQIALKVKALGGGELAVGLTSPVLVKDLYLYLGTHDARLSDNYFDLLPGETAYVRFKPQSALTAADLEGDLKLMHMAQVRSS